MSHYVDADGHIMEKSADLIRHLEEPWRSNDTVAERRLLPSLDEFHTPRFRKQGTFDFNVGPDQWLQYLDKTGLEFYCSLHDCCACLRSRCHSGMGDCLCPSMEQLCSRNVPAKKSALQGDGFDSDARSSERRCGASAGGQ